MIFESEAPFKSLLGFVLTRTSQNSKEPPREELILEPKSRQENEH